MFYVQKTCLVAIYSLLVFSSAMIYKLDMPSGLQTHFDGAKIKHNVSDIPGEQIFWECMQRVMWQMSEQMGHNVTRETQQYLDDLLKMALKPENRRIPRHRKEYRMITDKERDRFHSAVKALKNDTALKPNVYTAMAELHAGEVIPMAHFGAGFLGWHRIFLLIFETALRLKDPSVSVPYWASNLDHEMDDPTKSIIWSDKFLGTGDGFVTTGPFADFKVHSTDSILTRNIGSSGSLMTNHGIHEILSQNHTVNITNPTAPHAHNIELQHNMVHVWVGGNMDDLSISGEDPVFYLHHAYIDYLWEEFRTRQKLLGIDPEKDYPPKDWGSKEHAPEALLGFGDLRNIDALNNVFADLVKYDPPPVCSRTHSTCGSKYLRCDVSGVPAVCISLSRDELDNKHKDPVTDSCLESHLTRAVQNSFSINQFCDIRRWVYIPVKIILQRPPEFTNYKAYPVLNNKPVKTTDVFSTVSINKTISGNLAKYPNCKATTSIARNIYIESYGLNYYGKYKDFTVLDQRHALSSATAYLGVKSPESNHTDVIVYAYDYCGRSCRPFCFDTSSDPPRYRPCSGVIRVTTEEPKMYGDNYADAINNVWHADHPDSLPGTSPNYACVTFYCDFSGVWPWDEEMQNKTTKTGKNIHVKTDESRTSKPANNKRTPFAKKKSKSNKKFQPLPEVKVINQKQNVKRKTKQASGGKVNSRMTVQQKSNRRSNLSNLKPIPRSKFKKARDLARKSIGRSKTGLQIHQARARSRSTRPRPMIKPIGRQRNVRPIRQPLPLADRDYRAKYFSDRPERPVIRRPLFRHTFFRHELPPFAPELIPFPPECRLHPGCILPVPCSPCPDKDHQPCQVPGKMVAICINGVYILEHIFFSFIV